MPVEKAPAVSASEAKSLFDDLKTLPAVVLAVSGGPDSTALMVLAARWRAARKTGPQLIAVTVDHGLRAESKAEAQAVARLARQLGLAHRTVRWTGAKPKAGLPQAARAARYRLLGQAARKAGASHIVTAHTLDDQAETVLFRMMRGSGMTGLAAMQRISVIPGRGRSPRIRNPDMISALASGFRVRRSAPSRNDEESGHGDISLVRPLLDIPKARLLATLDAAKIPFADDPTNRDAQFTRARLRGVMPQLAREGLDAPRLALLARRLKRADLAIEAAVDRAAADLAVPAAPHSLAFDAAGLAALPAEIGLRLIGRAVAQTGDEGPVELAKLEALKAGLDGAQNTGSRFRRSLAGAIVTFVIDRTPGKRQITIERAPPRRGGGLKSLTKRRPGRAKARKRR